MKNERWIGLLGTDPRPWILESDEPAARWIALTHLLDRSDDDPEVIAAREAVLADPAVGGLVESLPEWEVDTGFKAHSSPGFAPNQLNLLADMGVRGGDFPAIERLLDRMLAHQDSTGRFESFSKIREEPHPVWGSLLCDAHAIAEVMVRFGRGGDRRVKQALDRMAADILTTDQGRAWPCIPHALTGFRGPGRKNDFCPQVTLEALRTFAHLPDSQRPAETHGAAKVALRAWRVRGEERPYIFGHGRQFKTVKWPTFWYDIHWMLDTLGRYPELWRGRDAPGEDRESLAELAACLIAYNFDENGQVTPRSCYKGFSQFSFGQKKGPSPFATARLSAVLRRLDDLADEIQRVDVMRLGSSKGGTGTPMPPK